MLKKIKFNNLFKLKNIKYYSNDFSGKIQFDIKEALGDIQLKLDRGEKLTRAEIQEYHKIANETYHKSYREQLENQKKNVKNPNDYVIVKN